MTSIRSGGLYVISVAARQAGVHVRTLRIYEVAGLLSPERTSGNQRHFSDEDMERVQLIRYLTQNFALSLAGVKLLFALHEAGRFEFQELVDFAEGKNFEQRGQVNSQIKVPNTDEENYQNG